MSATSPYTITDLVQFIRDEINEPNARIFTSGTAAYDLERFIDMGAKACSALTMCKQSQEDTSVVTADLNYYAMSTQFIKIESCEYCQGVAPEVTYGLQRIHPQAYGNVMSNATAGIGKYYFIHWALPVAALYVLPAPSAAMNSASGFYRVSGYSVVTQYGATTNQTLPDGLLLVPLYYALSCVYARLGKHRLSALNMQKFIDECNRWRSDVYGSVNRVDSYDLARIPDVTVTQQ